MQWPYKLDLRLGCQVLNNLELIVLVNRGKMCMLTVVTTRISGGPQGTYRVLVWPKFSYALRLRHLKRVETRQKDENRRCVAEPVVASGGRSGQRDE